MSATPSQSFPYLETESRRPLRWALLAAAIFHFLLLLTPLPYSVEAAPDPDKSKVFVVQPIVFKPPVLPPEEEIRTERARIVPVPDPTPDDPEPIRPLTELAPPVDLPPVDVVTRIPDAPPAEVPDGPLQIGGPVSRPVKIAGPLPIYPEAARRARIECIVMLHTVIDRSGRVTDVEPRKSCPLGLTEAAVRAAEQWRYQPALRQGLPVAVYMDLRVEFSLR